MQINVTVGGLDGTEPVKCSRDVVIVPDVALSSIDKDSFDVIVLPGGLGGANSMAASPLVKDLLKNQEKNGKLIAAICASPALVLKVHEIGIGKKVTCYPSFKEKLDGKFTFVDESVVQDGKLITSQGPSTVFDFALKIAENLVGAEKAKEVAKGILLKSI